MTRGGRGRLPLLLFGVAALSAARCARAENPCERATPKAVLVKDGEPGQKLRVRGTVYRPDGVTPAAGVIVYAYQTDAKGQYARSPDRTPRIRGWVRTDARGHFELVTIRPGNYPSRSTEAHIHTELWGSGAPPQWGPNLNFDDDELLRIDRKRESEALGRFGFVKNPVRGPDGVYDTDWSIRLKEKGDFFESNIRHGIEPCGVDAPLRRP
jgi:protocatechuate 3,4-dioxygenase beta subunit